MMETNQEGRDGRGVGAIRIAVDVGGTFTDLVVADQNGRLRVFKTPSTPGDPSRAVFHALERAAAAYGVPSRTLLAACQSFVHGTTVATNVMVQRTGARLGMLTTAGFRDVTAVRRGKRAAMWDYRSPYPLDLVERAARFGVRERIDHRGRSVTPLHEDDVRQACQRLGEDGIEVLIVCFLNSYLNDDHERRAAGIAREELPHVPVFCSAEVLPLMGEYERFSTTAVNAYVAPRTIRYLRRLHGDLVGGGLAAKLLVMESTGGVLDISMCEARPVLTVLSGPAAAAPAAQLFGECLDEANVVLFDMGGTSCDVVLVRNGVPAHTDEFQVASYDIALPAVDVSTIGAGGGTIAWVDAGGFLRVGPRSAGANPGPACYGKDGIEPTVTDANLILGRLNPQNFLGGEIRLNEELARQAVEERVASPLGLSVDAAALAILRVVNQTMIEAIKMLSLERGHDPRKFVLAAAGGAGGLHAGALARQLGMREAYVPRYAAVCCTLGMLHSDIRHDLLHSYFARLGSASLLEAARHLDALRRVGETRLRSEGFAPEAMEFRPAVGLRYGGQQWQIAIDVPWPLTGDVVSRVSERFHARHEELYGSRDLASHIEIVDVRLTAIGPTPKIKLWEEPMPGEWTQRMPRTTRPVLFEDTKSSVDAAVYDGRELAAGEMIAGPAIIEEPTTTIVVAPDEVARVDRFKNYRLSRMGSVVERTMHTSQGEAP